ncbi:MAG: CBS domain-containing protein [Candidatus Poseidoniaceae archaeon]|nr:CBS domain-containing protein [Candidatus Poseidoniaceae archaeon]
MMKPTAARRFTRDVISKMSAKERSMSARSISCGETMNKAHTIFSMDSVAIVLDKITQNNWDHVFIINEDGVPMGRIHAVDILKLIARKTVNRSVAWMHAVPAQQLVNIPPMTVRVNTPLLKAGALMLAHDINQIAVVDDDGTLVGVVGHNTMARHMPKFII